MYVWQTNANITDTAQQQQHTGALCFCDLDAFGDDRKVNRRRFRASLYTWVYSAVCAEGWFLIRFMLDIYIEKYRFFFYFIFTSSFLRAHPTPVGPSNTLGFDYMAVGPLHQSGLPCLSSVLCLPYIRQERTQAVFVCRAVGLWPHRSRGIFCCDQFVDDAHQNNPFRI
jgi:hypothetical protein